VPKVSVLMAAYDAEPYLGESVDSILNQTFTDFEFIIVEDGSTDSSPQILERYAKQDRRIRLVLNRSNLGLTPSLNNGLQLATADYVARQDADDISLPQRLALQVEFLDKHPEVGVLGTWMTNVDKRGQRVIWQTPTSNALIGWSLLFGTSIAHASVMLRRSLLEGNAPFKPEMLHAEDYDLWARLSEKTQLANLQECLYLRRMHKDRVSVRYHEKQEETTKYIMHNNMKKLMGAEIREELVSSIWNAICGRMLGSATDLKKVSDLYIRLYKVFVAKNTLDMVSCKEINHDLANRLTRLGLKHIRHWPADAIQILWAGIRLSPRASINCYLVELFKILICNESHPTIL